METQEARRDSMLAALVDLAVSHRRIAPILHADPAAGQLVREPPGATGGTGSWRFWSAPTPDVRGHVAGAMVGGAMMMVCISPELQKYADDELAEHLLELAQDLLSRHAAVGPGER